MVQPQIIYVTGLPQAGDTWLCQLLGQHPDIDATRSQSPLCSGLTGLRRQLSDDPALLNLLDQDFDTGYQRLMAAYRGFFSGWLADAKTPWVVDNHADWLRHGETLHHLASPVKLLVCVRELGQILGAIEAQHQRTPLLDFCDPLADLTKAERATRLYAEDGAVGTCLSALEAVQDYPAALQQSLYYVVFEHLMADPVAVVADIFADLQLPPHPVNLKPLPSLDKGGSSHRFKWLPQTDYTSPPPRYAIPDRFEITLRDRFAWFYRTFYPGLI